MFAAALLPYSLGLVVRAPRARRRPKHRYTQHLWERSLADVLDAATTGDLAFLQENEDRLRAAAEQVLRAVVYLHARGQLKDGTKADILLRKIFKPVVVYGLPDRDDIHWVVDYDRRNVYESDGLPDNWAVQVVMPAIVLRDCLFKKMFSCFSASKRLRVTVRSNHMRDYFILFQLLDMYEYEDMQKLVIKVGLLLTPQSNFHSALLPICI